VQDLQVDTRTARTQYQYTLEDADPDELAAYTPRLMRELGALRDLTSDLQGTGLALEVLVDRDTASRMGVTAQVIDDTLYSAFGQRQASLIFTQLNQYRVILELSPEDRRDPRALERLYVRAQGGGQVPLSAFCRFVRRPSRARGDAPGAVPGGDAVVQPAAGDVPRRRRGDHSRGRAARRHPPPGIRAEFQGSAKAFQESLGSQPVLILAALIAVYIVLGVLYESFIHPITILSTMPSAGVGAFLALERDGHRLQRDRPHRGHSAHRHREEERHHDDRLRAGGRARRGHLSPRRDSQGLPAALPPHHDDHPGRPARRAAARAGPRHGAELRRPLGVSIVGGLLLSQVLTLYTTPVIYLFMERARVFFTGPSPDAPPRDPA
jgi:multidrug efflux pump